jgi:hypothetical protein
MDRDVDKSVFAVLLVCEQVPSNDHPIDISDEPIALNTRRTGTGPYRGERPPTWEHPSDWGRH